MRDAIVIGSGLAGLTTALRLARGGMSVSLLSKGPGGLQLSQGTIDILGYAPDRVTRPLDALGDFAAGHPGHPYGLLGADTVRDAAGFLAELLPDLLVGDPEVNLQLPTAVGAVRPTALAQESMAAGDLKDGASYVIVGLRRLKDFQADLIAGNLDRAEVPAGGAVSARAVTIDVPVRDERDTTGLTYARALDDPSVRATFAKAVAKEVRAGEIVGLPGILGLDDHEAWRDVQQIVDHPVFEIPLPPPGVPGLRLYRTLSAIARDEGVRFITGSKVIDKRVEGDRVVSVSIDSAGRAREYAARHFVFAPGGFESGALAVDSYGAISETTFGLPLTESSAEKLIHGDYWGSEQQLFEVGVRVDESMRVLDADSAPVHSNFYAAGGLLAGAMRWSEKSGDGIAAASAVRAADTILREGN
ncbi:glycerol-3-phosphate dehydrogenase subunit GlpB [Nigerium massiliense]|uniref:glycerol-3-phosphate dehydrogenase subunit GlpB n=1 Tax=Nigerium massiliense TaxID=1522317 RepID=UPI00058FF858|nr:glycerol-3-phosphate dehydrogenase subunit GlpB [Nigerium massiliense]